MTTIGTISPSMSSGNEAEVCARLSEYSSAMMSAGGDTSTVERNLLKMNQKADVDGFCSMLGRKVSGGINLAALEKLVNISADNFGNLGSLTADAINTKRINPHIVLILTALANASFCRLFDGDFPSMGIVMVATLCGFYLKQRMLSAHWNARVATLLSAFVAAILGSAGRVFNIGNTPDIAIATSVLYLIPGIPFLNSMADFVNGHYLCAIERLCDAAITTACLSLGLCIALVLNHIGW